MIVTVTPNPSIDRTVALGTPLVRGAVHRVTSAIGEPGGKGVNVARALAAGRPRHRRRPARRRHRSHASPRCSAAGVAHRTVPVGGRRAHQPHDHRARRHHDQAERARRPCSTPAALDALTLAVLGYADRRLVDRPFRLAPARRARPTGTPTSSRSWPPRRARWPSTPPKRPLDALAAAFGDAAPDVIKPNAEELAGAGRRVTHRARKPLPPRAIQHPWWPRRTSSIDAGCRTVLVTLGAAGAVLVDPTGAWMAAPPPIAPRSTVGAGDCALAGYLRADVGAPNRRSRLQMAVAYGSAAAALPGSALPAPSQIDLNAVRVYAITPASSRPVTPPEEDNHVHHHHRPRRPRRRRRRRQGGRHRPARRSSRRRRADATDGAGLVAAAMAREAQSATGLPGGIAIPHCRSPYVDQPTLGFARLSPAGRLRRARTAPPTSCS